MKILNKSLNIIFSIVFIIVFTFILYVRLSFFDFNVRNIVLSIGILIFLLLSLWFTNKFKIKKFEIFLFIISVITQFIAVLILDVPPYSDFEMMYDSAQLLKVGDLSYRDTTYYISWAYQSGFTLYQAILLKIIDSIYFLQFVNCLFASGINVIVYLISKKLFKVKIAQAVSIFHLIYVFHFTHVALLTNSISASFFALLAIYFVIEGKYFKNANIRYITIGLMLAISDFFRPESIVFLVAIITYLIFSVTKNYSKKNLKDFAKRIVCLVGTLLLTGTMLSQMIIALDVNESGLVNNKPYWKFVVGLNTESRGKFHSPDWTMIEDRMREENLTFNESSKEIALERLNKPISEHIELQYYKVAEIWDEGGLVWVFRHIEDHDKILLGLEEINELIYMITLTLATIGVIYIIKDKKFSPRYLILLFLIFAKFCAYIPIEVQSRYSYAIRFVFFILACGGIEFIDKNLNGLFRKVKKIDD